MDGAAARARGVRVGQSKGRRTRGVGATHKPNEGLWTRGLVQHAKSRRLNWGQVTTHDTMVHGIRAYGLGLAGEKMPRL